MVILDHKVLIKTVQGMKQEVQNLNKSHIATVVTIHSPDRR